MGCCAKGWLEVWEVVIALWSVHACQCACKPTLLYDRPVHAYSSSAPGVLPQPNEHMCCSPALSALSSYPTQRMQVCSPVCDPFLVACIGADLHSGQLSTGLGHCLLPYPVCTPHLPAVCAAGRLVVLTEARVTLCCMCIPTATHVPWLVLL